MLGAALEKYLPTLIDHIQRASGVRTRVMQGTGEEVGLPHEESHSVELSGRWTGAHAEATALGACALENCVATCHPFSQVPFLRGHYRSAVLHQGPWLHIRSLLSPKASHWESASGALPCSAPWAGASIPGLAFN